MSKVRIRHWFFRFKITCFGRNRSAAAEALKKCISPVTRSVNESAFAHVKERWATQSPASPWHHGKEHLQVRKRLGPGWPPHPLGVSSKEHGGPSRGPFSPPGLNNSLLLPLVVWNSLLLFSQPVFNFLLWPALTVTSTQSDARG